MGDLHEVWNQFQPFWDWLTRPETLGVIAPLVALPASLIYILAILGWDWRLRRLPDDERTRPSRVTWLIWAILGFEVAISHRDSGASHTQWLAWVMAVDYAATFILSTRFGTKEWNWRDIVCLVGAGGVGYIWWEFNSPEVALYAALAVDAFGSYPTLEKVWRKPQEENRLAWTLFMLSCFINLAAVDDWQGDDTDAVYTVYMAIVNGAVTVLLWRPRKKT